jgi:hypothetical protein
MIHSRFFKSSVYQMSLDFESIRYRFVINMLNIRSECIVSLKAYRSGFTTTATNKMDSLF